MSEPEDGEDAGEFEDLLDEPAGEDDLEDDFGGLDLPPPPAPPPPNVDAAKEPPPPPPPELVEISKKIAASTDNLEMQALVHSALCASIADVLADTKISAADRRRELRTISAAAAKSFPYRRLYEAEQLVKADSAILEDRRRARAGATLEARPTAAKVIPIRGSAVPGGIKSQ